MKLREYLDDNGIKIDWFAKKLEISATHLSLIMSEGRHARKPSGVLKRLIRYETNGAVDAADWDGKQ